MTRLLQALHHRVALNLAIIRARCAALTGVTVGPHVFIGPACEVARGPAPARRGTVSLGEFTRLERGVLLHPYGGTIAVGRHVFLGPYTVVYGHGGVEIGHGTLVAMHCRILSSSHTLPSLDTHIRTQLDIPQPTKIGTDVWLGAGVTVLGGVTIGDGCVIGAGAVVTHDLPPGAIAAGVPARVIGCRPPPPARS